MVYNSFIVKKENIYYLIFIFTILLVRFGVFLFPLQKLMVGGTIVHHFWVGVVLVSFVSLLSKRYTELRMVLFSVALGLMVDELVYIILGAGAVSKYWSAYSVSGAIIMATIIFLARKKFTMKLF